MGVGAENSEWYANYGQDSSFAGTSTAGGNADANGVGDFYYGVPANHLALCASNLPDPSIELPGAYFNTILYDDGAGAKAGVGFAPDLVWLKSRGSANSHKWTDVVRGVTKGLSSDSSANETTDSTGLTAFGSDGFTVGADGNYSDTTGTGMVAWNWLAGGATTVTNTDGTRDAEVTANTAAGFSIIEFAGINDTTLTVGHGLSVAPTLVISKNRDESGNWLVYVPSLTNGKNLILNTNSAEIAQTAYIQGQSNTASVIQLNQSGGNDNLGRTGDTVIMYAFHSVAGYSKVDVYKGNDNSNGPFVYTGFTPAWIMTKALTSAYDWGMWDITRSVYNPVSNILEADNNQAELTGTKPLGPWGQGLPIDILSNGFKVRTTAGEVGANNIYAYVAFAKSPFKYSNAR